MKDYEVLIKEINYGFVRLKANSKESAIKKVQNRKNWLDSGFGDQEIVWVSVSVLSENGDILESEEK